VASFSFFTFLSVCFLMLASTQAGQIEFDGLINEGQSQQRAVANEVQQQSGVITWSSKKPTALPVGENASADSTVTISGDQGFKIKLKSAEKPQPKKKKRKLKTSSSPQTNN